MSILEWGLEKLVIHAYVDREMTKIVGSVTAMYNPDTLQQSYKTQYEPRRYINDDAQSNTYRLSSPGGMNLDLVFDARMPGNTRPLAKQMAELNALCCSVNAASGEPHFLKVSWGCMTMGGPAGRDFAGRATDMTVNYTLFDRDATPLRASVSLAFTVDSSLAQQAAQQSLQSPPVTVLSVPDGSSLSLVAKEGGAMLKGGIDLLSLADENDLDSLNDSEPGQILQASAAGGS